jgi:hypothetical protein
MKRLTLFFLCLVAILHVACEKDSFITSAGARVAISTDSLHFDTVFTTTGSVTQLFKIHNENDQRLKLQTVRLGGGNASSFKINVDGLTGPQVSDIEIDANDSVYVYVSVTIDPNARDLPFVMRDSIEISYNGNTRWVQLDAWGQNAVFLRSHIVVGNETWTNEKPYVVLGGLRIDNNATLIIEKGTRIYLHADAPIIVDGSLRVNGEHYDSTRVRFQSDRLDEPYRDFPAGWPGIFFRSTSRDNMLNYAIIKNAYQGIVSEGPSGNTNRKVTLNECIIDNCYDAGILGIGSSIDARNCLISNCGKGIIFAYGGDYRLRHCTDVSVSNLYVTHKEPVLVVTNFIKEGDVVYTADLNAVFENCIFWGDNGTVENEVIAQEESGASFNVRFQNCLWKIKETPANVTAIDMLANEDPLFQNIDIQKRLFDFRLKEGSPAINRGIPLGVAIDLDAKPRNVPDLGCYEKE